MQSKIYVYLGYIGVGAFSSTFDAFENYVLLQQKLFRLLNNKTLKAQLAKLSLFIILNRWKMKVTVSF